MAPKVAFLMADYGHDPTETAIPFQTFVRAGFDVAIVTETGTAPRCDRLLLAGPTGRLLGAAAAAVAAHNAMQTTDAWQHPLAWSAPGFSLAPFALVFLPGGHERSVQQVLTSAAVHALLADYFPTTRRDQTTTTTTMMMTTTTPHAVAAVCHGVMVLSATRLPSGASVLHDCTTTALPARYEQVAFWGTRLFLGDYYKTFGAGSENVEDAVRKVLDDPAQQWKCSLNPVTPFVVEDPTYRYLSARYPADAQLLADKAVRLVQDGIQK